MAVRGASATGSSRFRKRRKTEAFRLDDFDRYVEENEISEDDYPAAFAQWIARRTGQPGEFEKVEENHE